MVVALPLPVEAATDPADPVVLVASGAGESGVMAASLHAMVHAAARMDVAR